jgi:asparagine synthase (glutamine-hydrolysing)
VNGETNLIPSMEIPGTGESGIQPASWHGWPLRYSCEGVHLFINGSVAPDLQGQNDFSAKKKGCNERAIVELYLTKGDEFIKFLRGSFGLALWDSRNQKLVAGTDHFGTRSVYYSNANGRIAVSPRLDGCVEAMGSSREIEPNSIYFFLNHSFIPAPFTILKNVHRLKPGHMLVWTDGRLIVRKYWDMSYDEDKGMGEAAAAASLRSSVADAVRFAVGSRNCRSDELGAFLSGGTDSSTLVGLLNQTDAKPIKSFSVGFEDHAYNEIHYARVAANHFKSKAYEYFVHPDEALTAIDAIAAVFDEPFGNSSAIPTFFCLKMARQEGVKFMFAGDGGDELFGGNERYITEKVFTLYRQIPSPLRSVIDLGAKVIPAFYPWRKVKNYVCKANQSPIERFFAYQLYFRDHADEYFTSDFKETIAMDFPIEVPKQHYACAGNVAFLNRLLYVDLKLAIADNDLFKVNRMGEMHGIQVLYPYLDPHVGVASGKIPAALKVKGWSKRYIFKKAFEKFLPEEILQKKKHGFGLPTGDWLRNHPGFRDLARSLLLDACSLQRGFFRQSALERLLQRHDEESSSYYGSQIWNLMMLELWHRNHFDRATR